MGANKKSSSSKKVKENIDSTSLFEKICTHELFSKIPEMCLPYSVKSNSKGKVFYLNENLCSTLGILDKDFSLKDLNLLKKEILELFNLQIINDYDRLNHTSISSKDVKPYFCFATRYLQLQHKNTLGKTSGDGRAIWNGTILSKGTIWDISSRGTGVTSLAPGIVDAGKPLPTGTTEYGYSCGLSELKEIYASIIMSERFYKMGFSTERIIAGIDIGNGYGVCVRASENLIRPAHLFRYLKLNDHHGSKILLDHVINRDFKNKKINFNTQDKNCYDKYLEYFAQNFITLCAKSKYLEVFLWLDWDGDNILVDGGIIDYGSVRHFGAHHNKYRYDDGGRYSTNLDEQIKKTQLTVQIFSQLVDFVQTSEKKTLNTFKNNVFVKSFSEKVFKKEVSYFLKDLGLSKSKIKGAFSWHSEKSCALYESFLKLKQKKASKIIPSPDGLNAWPVFNVNHMLSDLKNISKESDLDKFKTEFTSFTHNKNIDTLEVFNFIKQVEDLENHIKFKFKYSGDAKIRLTTAAILHIVDLIADSKSELEKQKKLNSSIDYGYLKNSSWITVIKDLYRDEL